MRLLVQIVCATFGRNATSGSLVEVRVREQRPMPQIELTVGVEIRSIAEDVES